jgi:small subunit ribosomal protein S13
MAKPDAPAPAGRRIVRVLATDIDGNLPVERALRKIKGISFMFSRSTCIAMNIDGKRKIGLLGEQEVRSIEEFIRNPKLPAWMLNRRADPETGLDGHLTMSGLDLRRREDINTMKRIRSYKGIRHELGQPVRGQRTRSTFRTQKSVGVQKKKAMPAKGAAPKEAKK